MIGFNAGRIGTPNIPSVLGTLDGIWSPRELATYKLSLDWPLGIVSDSLLLFLWAGYPDSYKGTGTTWKDISEGFRFELRNSPTYDSADGGSFRFQSSLSQDAGIRTGPVTTQTSNTTQQVWVNLPSTGQRGYFFHNGSNSDGNGFGVGNGTLDNYGNELVGLYDQRRWIPTGTNIGTGWKFVTFTIDSSGQPSFYINTTAVSPTNTGNTNTPYTPNSFAYVASNESGSRLNDGKISQVYFYTKQLTAAEVAQNFNATRSLYGV